MDVEWDWYSPKAKAGAYPDIERPASLREMDNWNMRVDSGGVELASTLTTSTGSVSSTCEPPLLDQKQQASLGGDFSPGGNCPILSPSPGGSSLSPSFLSKEKKFKFGERSQLVQKAVEEA